MRASAALLALAGLVAAACTVGAGRGGHVRSPAATTYEKFYPQAQAGEPMYQNLIGFMHFFGEGAPIDREVAHLWFHLAAESGYPPAQRNLAIMHRLGIGAAKDLDEARLYARAGRIADLEQLIDTVPAAVRDGGLEAEPGQPATPEMARGEATYATFCAGCHGLNGIAAYVDSPSFALGERMDRSDTELYRSISNGKGVMPGWGGKLSEDRLHEVLQFVRGLRASYDRGIAQALRRAPGLYFLFGPMTDNDAAYRGPLAE